MVRAVLDFKLLFIYLDHCANALKDPISAIEEYATLRHYSTNQSTCMNPSTFTSINESGEVGNLGAQ